MKLRSWLILVFSLFILCAALGWLTQTQSGLNSAVWIAEKLTPGQLKIQNASGKLFGDFQVQHATYDNVHVGLTFDEVKIQWQPWKVITSHVDLNTVNIAKTSIVIKKNPNPSKKLFVPEDLKIPFVFSIQDGHVEEITYQQGRAFVKAKVLKLNTRWAHKGFDINQLDLQNEWGNASVHGFISARSAKENNLEAEWHREDWHGKAAARGIWQDFKLTAQLIKPTTFEFDAQLKNLLTTLEWESILNSKFENSALKLAITSTGKLDDWKAVATIDSQKHITKGIANIIGQRDHAIINKITLQQEKTGQLEGHGEIFDFTEHPKAFLKINWENLQWQAQNKTIEIPAGELEFKGDHKDFSAHLYSDFDLDSNFHLENKLNLKGNLQKIILSESEIRVNNKAITLSGELATETTDWHLNWNSQRLTIPSTDYWHTIETALQGEANGNLDREEFSVVIPKMTGTWGKLAYSGQLNAKRENGLLKIDQQFQVGKNTATIKAQYQNKLDAVLDLNFPQMEQIFPSIKGDLKAAIKILNDDWTGQLQAKTLEMKNKRADNIVLSLTGTKTKHIIKAQFGAVNNQLDLVANGGISNNQWAGKISDLTILGATKKAWHLEKSTAITLDKNSIKMPDTLCLRENDKHICAKWNKQNTEQDFILNAKTLPMDLLKLIPALKDTKWNGVFDAKANYKINEQTTVGTADLVIYPGTLTNTKNNWHEVLQYQGGNVHVDAGKKFIATADLQAWPGTKALATLELPNFNPSTHSDFMKQTIRGEVSLEAPDLKPFALVSPSFSDLSGRIQGKISIAGQLSEPKFSGKLQLLNGQADIPAAGIKITDLIMNLSATADNNLSFDAQAKSGTGSITAKGTALFKNNTLKTDIKISGDNFKAVDLPEAQIFATPDLLLSYQNEKLMMTGTVKVNKAKIEPRDFRDYQAPSKDVTIVGSKPKDVQNVFISSDVKLVMGENVKFSGFNLKGNITGQIRVIQQPGRKTRANGELNVEKGQYNIYGQTLNIQRGRLLFAGGQIDNPGLDVRAEREIKVIMTPSSQFQLLNQTNSTQDEKDIRDGVVGISLRGTLMQPDVHFYSNPALTEADKLSYLVVGVPSNNVSGAQSTLLTGAVSELADKMGLNERNRLFNQLEGIGHLDQVALESRSRYDAEKGLASSQTSLVLGKALSPKLFVSYSIGLLDPVSILQVRYKISRSWSLQTDTSNLGQGGGDLIYSLDKD